MKQIIIYQTDDGSRFENIEEAIKYENLCKVCIKINNKLKNLGRTLEINEYIQQDLNVVKEVYNCFLDIVAETLPKFAEWAIQVKNGERHISLIGRIISDHNIKCLYKLYYRLLCISLENGKEFCQPYLVEHQEEATVAV